LSDKALKELSVMRSMGHIDHVICRLRGGLGNQIFQLAAAIFVSAKHDASISLAVDAFAQPRLDARYRGQPNRVFELKTLFGNQFSFTDKVGISAKASIRLARANRRTIAQLPAIFAPSILLVEFKNEFSLLGRPSSSVLLDGYWQTAALARAVEPELRSLYRQVPEALVQKATEGLRRHGFGPFVAVHIRRGDYVSGLFDTTPLPISYYENAIKRFPGFVPLIFTDDIEWCRSNIDLPNGIFWDDIDALTSFVAMSLCDANLIANSTYSWWAAWFNEHPSKRVAAPAQWYKPQSPYASANSYVVDEQWIAIDL
jgi:hypothetical protein